MIVIRTSLVCLALAVGRTSAFDESNSLAVNAQRSLTRTLTGCGVSTSGKETVLCLRRGWTDFVKDVTTARELTVVPDYLTLVKDGEDNDTDVSEQSSRSLVDTVARVFSNRRIQLRLPAFSSLFEDEGRGKKNDKGYAVVGLMLGGSMLAMGLAGLAALAGKALAISMAALMLAALAAMKKGHEGGGHHSSYDVVSLPVHGHRSLYYLNEPPVVESSSKSFAFENLPSEH